MGYIPQYIQYTPIYPNIPNIPQYAPIYPIFPNIPNIPQHTPIYPNIPQYTPIYLNIPQYTPIYHKNQKCPETDRQTDQHLKIKSSDGAKNVKSTKSKNN